MSDTETNGVARVKTAVERLAEIRQRQAETEAESRAEKEEADAIAELEKLDVVEKLKAEHPGIELYRVDTVAGMAIIRSPSVDDYSAFQRARRDPKRAAGAPEILTTAGTVYPAHAVLMQWKKKHPAVLDSIADRVIELAGSDTETKKL